MRLVREPLRWCLQAGERTDPGRVGAVVRSACRGPSADDWTPPPWLLPHQLDAARRIAARVEIFRGALLADAVGLGKTFVALAVATRYRRPAVIAPPQLVSQWQRVASGLGISIVVRSDFSLSRGQPVPTADLLIVDEAHRFRKPDTRRYHALAVRPGATALLLVTATPVVNSAADLVSLLELFLPDNALAVLGVPSLRQAVVQNAVSQIARAATAVMVARSPEVIEGVTSIPRVRDFAVVSKPALAPSRQSEVLALMRELTFPTFGDPSASALLALHLRHRLASSGAACRQTLARHSAYLQRATAAAQRGERISRKQALRHFAIDDDFQLSLDLIGAAPTAPLNPLTLVEEKKRVDSLVARLGRIDGPSPKAEHLGRILAARGGCKTIVFTSAIATAHDLARRLGWRRLAVVSGHGAWIASGPVPVDEALSLFAPAARGIGPPSSAQQVDTLIATDLASEGLDLQDADAVVHYDLPWTPLRLEQRLGRIARLGSVHPEVGVWWFSPPEDLENDLALCRRIAAKAGRQLALGVSMSSRVGSARITGRTFQWQERMAANGPPERRGIPCYSIVNRPAATVIVLDWTAGGRTFPDVIVIEGGEVITDEDLRTRVMQDLMSAPAVPGKIPAGRLPVIHHLVRRRLTAMDPSTPDERTVKLCRALVRRATIASQRRDASLLSVLDQALTLLVTGTSEGAKRQLEGVLMRSACDSATLRRWLNDYPPNPAFFTVRLVAALFGTGS